MKNPFDQSTFANKFLSRLDRIDQSQIESFIVQLLREKDFHKLVFDSLSEGVFVADSGGRLIFANEPVRGILGVPGQKLIGRRVTTLLKSKALRSLLQEFLEEKQPIRQREVRLRGEQIRIFRVSVLPVIDEEGELAHSVWILSDQTEAHRRAAEQHQYESIRSLATLIAGIAHEIKNPLNSLNIHAQLVQQMANTYAASAAETDPQLERLQQSTGILLEEIERLTRIVNQFIKAARPPALTIRPARINEVIGNVAELIRPECQGRSIDLEEDYDPEIPVIRCDPEQLLQAILNIARNAIESIDKPAGLIVLRTALKSDHVLIEITDNGCGIAEADRLKIFEPYHTTKFDGSGLGLMIVFRIVNAHGGEIGLDSQIGEGTSFKIALPVDERPIRLLETTTVVGEKQGKESRPAASESAESA